MAVVIFIGGLYISLVGLKANHIAVAQATKLTQDANNSSESNPALATVKPTASDLANYTVAPDLPRYIKIPKLGVDARVLSVGVNSKGEINTPNNINDTAWYNESSKPGEDGAMLIDGHISSWTANGVFYNLKELAPGDLIQIIRGDNTFFTYKVVKTVVYPANNVDMQSALKPVVPGTPGLNLISCYGDVEPGTNLFNERIVVYTEQLEN
jgi:sortase (surface protein transpeptidase)